MITDADVLLAALAVLMLGGPALAEVGEYAEFQRVLDAKCSRCHTRDRIA